MPLTSSRRREAECDLAEQHLLRTVFRQVHADATCVFDDARPDLKQFQAQRIELGSLEHMSLRDRRTHGVHQPERRRRQHQPDLIGDGRRARCAVRRQLRFVQLDQVFRLPTLAVGTFVEPLRVAVERCYDATNVDLLAHGIR
jgi:hypothetical protein